MRVIAWLDSWDVGLVLLVVAIATAYALAWAVTEPCRPREIGGFGGCWFSAPNRIECGAGCTYTEIGR